MQAAQRMDLDVPGTQTAGRTTGRGLPRLWLLVGLLTAAVMTAIALGPQVAPLGTPTGVVNTGQGDSLSQPAISIYQACRTMAWVAEFGGCGAAAANDPY